MKGSIHWRDPLGSLCFRFWTLLSFGSGVLACSTHGSTHAVSASVPSPRAPEAAAPAVAPSHAQKPAQGHWDFTVVNRWHLCEVDDLDDCTRQCRSGHLSSCVRLGNMYAAGTRVPKDLAAAAELYELPCGFHIGVACSNRASIFAHDYDMARAADYFGRGCDAGDGHGCYRLGVLLEGGLGIPADPGRAVTVYQRACNDGELPACSNLGRLYVLGQGVERDDTHAVLLFRRACDGGNAGGCGNLGSAYQAGVGVARDCDRATELHKRACDGGATDFCTSVLAKGDRNVR